MHVPAFENDARASLMSDAPAVIALGTRAGDLRQASAFSLPRGDGDGDTVVDHAAHGSVDGRRCRPAEAHVGDGRLAGGVVPDDPVDAGDDLGVGAAAGAVEDPYRPQAHALGNAVGGPADGAGHMGAVAVAVVGRSTVDGVEAARWPARRSRDG